MSKIQSIAVAATLGPDEQPRHLTAGERAKKIIVFFACMAVKAITLRATAI